MKQLVFLLSALLALLSACGPAHPDFVFKKPELKPILGPDSLPVFFCPVKQDSLHWKRADVFNPAAIVKDGKVALLFRAEDNPAAAIGGRTSRIGLAFSEDGLHFKPLSQPVLYPDNDNMREYEYPGGCEDPRVVQHPDGGYIMTYTAWNGKTARLSVAYSKDLVNWTKYGPAFRNAGQQWLDTWSKSGAILCQWKDGNPVAVKLDGKYWMYWGDTNIFLATSDDLSDWRPVTGRGGDLRIVAKPRDKQFDSDLVEPGPPAILTDKGIWLIYNAKNTEDHTHASHRIAEGSYSCGALLLSRSKPARVTHRAKTPFLFPSLHHETNGQYQSGTTFAEGLVGFKGKYYLYYGTADSYVGVAVADEMPF